MLAISQLNSGWNGPQTRRSRQRAAPKPSDPRKTVKPTPRGKYGLGPRREVLEQTGDGEGPTDNSWLNSSSSTLTAQQEKCLQFYQQIVEGKATKQHPAPKRKLLFQRPQSVKAQVITPALLRKVVPAIVHTRHWPRLQRKILPRFLFVLNESAAVALFRTLVALQPPSSPPSAVVPTSEPGTVSPAYSNAKAGDQQVPATICHTAYAAPSSITGAFRRRHQLSLPSTTAASDPAIIDAAAVARGFKDAWDERRQFSLMLEAVYVVLQDKLEQWQGRRLIKLLGYAAQLQVQLPPPQTFMQAWFAATEEALQHETEANLVVCLEALACLHVQPPQQWLDKWTAASHLCLQQLSLQQLAMLSLHVAELRLQLPPDWWAGFCSTVLMQASSKLRHALDFVATQQLAYDRPRQQGEQQQQQLSQTLQQTTGPNASIGPSARLQPPQGQLALTRPAADALCSILWSCWLLGGFKAQEAWLRKCLNFALPAVQQGQCSSGAAVQLLHACTIGACKQTALAVAAQTACLVTVQHRLTAVCASSALPLLLDCLEAMSGQQLEHDGAQVLDSSGLHQQQILPEGFCQDLEAALTLILPQAPNSLLLKVARTLKCLQYKPGLQLLSAFSLVTTNHMTTFSSQDFVVLVECCHGWGVAMPDTWVSAVLQHLQQLSSPHESTSKKSSSAGHHDHVDLAEVLSLLPALAADWNAYRLEYAEVMDLLQHDNGGVVIDNLAT